MVMDMACSRSVSLYGALAVKVVPNSDQNGKGITIRKGGKIIIIKK